MRIAYAVSILAIAVTSIGCGDNPLNPTPIANDVTVVAPSEKIIPPKVDPVYRFEGVASDNCFQATAFPDAWTLHMIDAGDEPVTVSVTVQPQRSEDCNQAFTNDEVALRGTTTFNPNTSGVAKFHLEHLNCGSALYRLKIGSKVIATTKVTMGKECYPAIVY